MMKAEDLDAAVLWAQRHDDLLTVGRVLSNKSRTDVVEIVVQSGADRHACKVSVAQLDDIISNQTSTVRAELWTLGVKVEE